MSNNKEYVIISPLKFKHKFKIQVCYTNCAHLNKTHPYSSKKTITKMSYFKILVSPEQRLLKIN